MPLCLFVGLHWCVCCSRSLRKFRVCFSQFQHEFDGPVGRFYEILRSALRSSHTSAESKIPDHRAACPSRSCQRCLEAGNPPKSSRILPEIGGNSVAQQCMLKATKGLSTINIDVFHAGGASLKTTNAQILLKARDLQGNKSSEGDHSMTLETSQTKI